jgi:hypothetical protein
MDRERDVERRSTDFGQGAMTDSTGSLTPDHADEEFVPAETAGMNDPARTQAMMVAARKRRRGHAQQPDRPGQLIEAGPEIPANDRDGGYGSQHGLAEGDPAYHIEQRRSAEGGAPAPGSDEAPRLGGDEKRAPEDEHF